MTRTLCGHYLLLANPSNPSQRFQAFCERSIDHTGTHLAANREWVLTTDRRPLITKGPDQ